MIDNKVVGQAISRMRQEAGMTQQALASCLNVSHQAVSKWENGTALPDVLTLLEISKLFGITMEQLLSGEVPQRYEKEQPIREQPIELKIDLNPLSQRVQEAVNEADKIINESADGASENSEGNSETDAEESRAEASSQPDEDIDIEKIISMAPFMSREALNDIALRYKGKCTANQLARLAPFISSEALEKLIINSDNEIDWDTLRRLAPFLKREAVDALTMAVAKGEKYFRSAAKDMKKSTKDLGRTISHGLDKAFRHLNDLGSQLNREIQAGKKSCAKPMQEQPARTVSGARSRIFQRALDEEKFDWIAAHLDQLEDAELRERIARRARDLGMNDWIAENMDDYFDQDSLDKAIISGDWEIISDHLSSADDDTCEMIISSALTEGRWDWLTENLDEISLTDASILDIIKAAVAADKWDWLHGCIDMLSPEDEALDMLIASAVAAGKWDWINENIDDLDVEPQAAELAEKAYAAGRRDVALEIVDEYGDSCDMDKLIVLALDNTDADFVDKIMEHVSTDTANSLCRSLAREGRLKDAAALAEHVDEKCLAELLDLASDTDDWELIDKINDLL